VRQQGHNYERERRQLERPPAGPEPFDHHLGSGRGFRRHQRSVNGLLMGAWQEVTTGQSRLLGVSNA
jgi:hypothetical protein